MEYAAFTLIWVGFALYIVLAGSDFGVGVWVLVSYAFGRERGERLRRDAFGYFGPVWEVNTLFLVFFMVGLMAAFPKVLALLAEELMPLVLFALVMFVFRAAAYALLHHGPERTRGPATVVFAAASVLAGVGLGYAAVAPASGFIVGDELRSAFYTSAVALTSLPMSLAACAHLSAVVIAAFAAARGSEATGWWRWAALAAGVAVFPTVLVFSGGMVANVEHTSDRLTGPLAIPMVLGAISVALGTLALWRRRFGLAALLVFGGYFAGLLGGAFAQLPYMVYPALTLEQAASPDASLTAYLAVTGLGFPLLVAALLALYHTTLGPGRGGDEPGSTPAGTAAGGAGRGRKPQQV